MKVFFRRIHDGFDDSDLRGKFFTELPIGEGKRFTGKEFSISFNRQLDGTLLVIITGGKFTVLNDSECQLSFTWSAFTDERN